MRFYQRVLKENVNVEDDSQKFQSDTEIRGFLHELFNAAIAAADPERCLPDHLPEPPVGRTIIVGAGKAASKMLACIEGRWQGELEGLVIVPYGYGQKCEGVRIIEAGHPIPDIAGNIASKQILEFVTGAGGCDLVIFLISGGASSLLSLPLSGLTADDKAQVHSKLLKSGADITEINCVRKHLSAVKGGRLAMAAAPARVVTFLVSDVPGDDPSVIGSGPTIANTSSCHDAAKILAKYDINEPEVAIKMLEEGKVLAPSPTASIFTDQSYQVIASPQLALEAAANLAKKRGIEPLILGDSIEGEAKEVAKAMAGIAQQVRNYSQPLFPPAVLLSGGETTVTVNGKGVGGRNSEFQLALALKLRGAEGIFSLAADTDGIDGNGENAGAFITPDTLKNATLKSIDALDYLRQNNSAVFFQKLNDLFITGPTHTNVNDFRAILILPQY